MKIATKERPILFSGPMVRAILEGKKTQARRVVKLRPHNVQPLYQMKLGGGGMWSDSHCEPIACPFGVPGDQLWVREALDINRSPNNPRAVNPTYRADAVKVKMDAGFYNPLPRGPTCASNHMPRWAFRTQLEVTKIRVEEIQEISEEDAKAEGITARYVQVGSHSNPTAIYPAFPEREGGEHSARAAFETLWESINAKRGFGWDINPWVWVIEFQRVIER